MATIDLIFVFEAPDNVAASAVAIAETAASAVRTYKTRPLIEVDDGLAAMKKAGEVAALYKPPTGWKNSSFRNSDGREMLSSRS